MEAIGTRTEHDVGEILRRWGPPYSRTHPMTGPQRRVMREVAACRTAALGGHLERCEACGYEHPVYNSCGNRHCPKCLGVRARKWLRRRLDEVLNTPYFHCVFTLPDGFDCLVRYNARVMYDLLFRATAWTLQRFARDQLDGELGITAVLHTWGQTLWLHPHVHAIVTGGALSFDRRRWTSNGSDFLFDVHCLSNAFRDRFCTLLGRTDLVTAGDAAHLADPAALEAFIETQRRRKWVVYVKPPVQGPRQVLEYISRYTHRVAVSNRRIRGVAEDGTVTLAWKDYRHCDRSGRPVERLMELPATEFIGRFLRHVLPPGFRKVRSYGLHAGVNRQAKLTAARALLGPVPEEEPADPDECCDAAAVTPAQCPNCGSTAMVPTVVLAPQPIAPVVLKCVPHAPNLDAA